METFDWIKPFLVGGLLMKLNHTEWQTNSNCGIFDIVGNFIFVKTKPFWILSIVLHTHTDTLWEQTLVHGMKNNCKASPITQLCLKFNFVVTWIILWFFCNFNSFWINFKMPAVNSKQNFPVSTLHNCFWAAFFPCPNSEISSIDKSENDKQPSKNLQRKCALVEANVKKNELRVIVNPCSWHQMI